METPPPVSPEPLPPSPGPVDPTTQQWKVILHASAFSGLVIPFGTILGPLIVWLIKKTELPAIDPEGRKVLNFQISYAIYGIASIIIATVGSCLYVPIILPIIVGIAWLVFTILGTVKTSNGEDYKFPYVLKLL
jgi:uncharacterized Tic20 family protein